MLMQATRTAAMLLLAPTFAGPLAAQDSDEIELPAYAADQRLERAAETVVAGFAGGLAYARSRGETADDFGHFLADLYAPRMSRGISGSAMRIACKVTGW